ncbi:hypothetical protein [Pseudoalteromonas sp. SW0106-04]|uniref:hypothetical protein n=1 Tax=Pseudoalteromonas sp. SW0106-04 TaxID=1702169 RepID=UPI0006B5CA14|nr:hypothetical protein [Pseudoalteromonas sp. SW0106-04]
MVTEAYQKGRKAKSYSDNPYDKNSGQYDDFERGFTQKLKRMPAQAFTCESGPIGGDPDRPERDSLKGSRFVDEKPKPHTNSYAEARKK